MRNYLSEMLYALTSAYNRKDYDNRQRGAPLETNIGKLFSIFAWGLDSVQEQAELVLLWDNIDNARGAVLDRYGANFGVKRVSSDDRFYRLAIKVKVMSQLSGGDIDTVLVAAATLLDVENSDVLLEEVYPAKIALYVDQKLIAQELLDLIEEIAWAIKRILATGVGIRLYLRTYRTYRLDVPITRLTIANAHLTGEPVSQDRENAIEWRVNFGGFTGAAYELYPFGEDRMSRMAVQTAQGAFQKPKVVSYPPDAEKTLTGRTEAAGGAVYHAHIKSKRID